MNLLPLLLLLWQVALFHGQPPPHLSAPSVQKVENAGLLFTDNAAGVSGTDAGYSIPLQAQSLWLFGDVGVPKSIGDQAINRFPTSGYSTEFSTRQPVPGLGPGQGWAAPTVPQPNKQAACRHGQRAAFAFCDGHAENWKWADLVTDDYDVFGLYSY